VVVAGQSLGGLTALRTVLQHGDVIGAAIAQSASLWAADPTPELRAAGLLRTAQTPSRTQQTPAAQTAADRPPGGAGTAAGWSPDGGRTAADRPPGGAGTAAGGSPDGGRTASGNWETPAGQTAAGGLLGGGRTASGNWQAACGLRAYIEVGLQEWVLLEPNRRLAGELAAGGADVRFTAYNGGHDYACWRGGIADGLRWLLAANP
jgi:enterochelin esterase family protein